jgi:hypothetical protein
MTHFFLEHPPRAGEPVLKCPARYALEVDRAAAQCRDALRDADPSVETPVVELRRDGKFWSVSFDGQSARVKHTKGMTHIKELIDHPREHISVAVLLDLEDWKGAELDVRQIDENAAPGGSREPAATRLRDAAAEGDHEGDPSRSEEGRIKAESRRIKKEVESEVGQGWEPTRLEHHQFDDDATLEGDPNAAAPYGDALSARDGNAASLLYGDGLSITLGGARSEFDRGSRKGWEAALNAKGAALKDAEESGAAEAVKEARQDLARWQRELNRHYNHKWRERDPSSLLERARKAAGSRMRLAMKNIGKDLPALEKRLKIWIRGSGGGFSYDPTRSPDGERRDRADRKVEVYAWVSRKLVGGYHHGKFGWQPVGEGGRTQIEDIARRKAIVDRWLIENNK